MLAEFILRLLDLEGVGTELGLFTLGIMAVLATLSGALVRWKWAQGKRMLAEHKEMWERFYRKKKEAESVGLQRTREAMKADQVSLLMRNKEKR